MFKVFLIVALVAAINVIYQTAQSAETQMVPSEPSMPLSDPPSTTNETFVDDTIETAKAMAGWVAYEPSAIDERIALWASAYHHQIMIHSPEQSNQDYRFWFNYYYEVRSFVGLPYEGTTFYLWTAVFRAEYYRLMYQRPLSI